MRLICGILRLDGAALAGDVIDRMGDALAGPQLSPARATWSQGPIALAVLDFDQNRDGDTVLQTRPQGILAADLRLDDVPHGADEVHLAQAMAGGAAAIAGLLGDFAAALWDPASGTLTCARDHLGIRPLSYHYRPGEVFAFASFPRALSAAGLVSTEPNVEAVLRRMVHAFGTTISPLIGVQRLAPAHSLTVSRDGLTLRRYWQLDHARAGRNPISHADAAAEMLRLTQQAIACRLPATGEVGVHLTGGLDSSAITVLAARALRAQGRRLHAWSFLDRLTQDNRLEDETAFVGAVCDQEGDLDWMAVRPGAPANLDTGIEPDTLLSRDPDDPEEQVCVSAAARGVHVILSGWGGDEAATYTGPGALPELLMRGHWRSFRAELRAEAAARGQSTRSVLYTQVIRYLLPERVADLIRLLARRDPAITTLFTRSLRAGPRAIARAAQRDCLKMVGNGVSNRLRLIEHGHVALPVENCAAYGARHGIAFTFPLLDRRVVEFAISLPSSHFQRGGSNRNVFRDAMAGVLPDSVRLRHVKFRAFPGRELELLDNKAVLIRQLEDYRTDPRLAAMFNFALLLGCARTLPDADEQRARLRGNQLPDNYSQLALIMTALEAMRALSHHSEN